MTPRKRVALLLGHVEESYQSTFIKGFFEQMFSYDYDVCVFAMYNKYQETVEREQGESVIFSLVNPALFDGIVILSDTIQTPGLAEKLEERFKENYSGPVVCVDKQSKYYPTLITDHYFVCKKLVEHLIVEHGYKDIAYLTGKEEHIHSQERLKAYKDCMNEYNLPINENRIFYGDFWYGCGENVVKKLLIDENGLPEAIACANDCMAISVAIALEAYGLKVPEDIAVIGYDSTEDGRKSPSPLTSAPIPAKENGINAAGKIYSLINGSEFEPYKAENELFIGNSCGCKNFNSHWVSGLRSSWKTIDSQEKFNSRFNCFIDDLISKSNFKDLINTIFAAMHHLGDYESFSLCLNSQWMDSEMLHSNETKWDGYSEEILPVLSCKRDGSSNKITYSNTFDKDTLLPELYEERENPSGFYFTPLHFEERCLGYAVLSYGGEVRTYSEVYWEWLRNIMQGLECYRRFDSVRYLYQQLEANQTRDNLTGLYNYQGMLQKFENISGKYVGAIAVDIRGLADINDKHGRAQGNYAIKTVSTILKGLVERGLCCVLGNGEFVGVELYDSDVFDEQIYIIKDDLIKQVEEVSGLPFNLSVYVGCGYSYVSEVKDLEHLINTTVAQKNGNKIAEQKIKNRDTLTDEEFKEMMAVQDIMDNNRLIYHFQPIVNAKTGDIYAYEALMRADVEQFISPLTIIKYADYMGRLYDIEKLTFFNVLKHIRDNENLFDGKKVFINSIPDNRLQGYDADELTVELEKYSATVVVELTEQAELPDAELTLMKKEYASMGIETAVDDYGTGYSNVTNLLRYMPNYVKIDRMLLSEIQDSPQKQHFVREIIEFAHNNDIMALAEGVETNEELQMIIALGVDLIQGYYTARPSREILTAIDKDVREEIARYHRQLMLGNGSKIYVAGKESRIHLAKLVTDKYSIIEFVPDNIVHKDITLTGISGVVSNVILEIKEGYKGRIVLENASFASGKNSACINIEENCNVTLVLKGENFLNDGGIRVADNSILTIEGEGDISINSEKDNYFGIGNDVDSKHGSIIFDQDGCVDVRCNGAKGVGIGSGLGGLIDIRKGKYIIELTGEEGVGIGTRSGDINIGIAMCNMNLKIVTTNNVGIGSMYGNVDVNISHILLQSMYGGTFSAGIGTLYGQDSKIEVANSNINMNLRAIEISAIGSAKSSSVFDAKECAFNIKGEGRAALAFGNSNNNCKLRFLDCDVDSDIKSNLETDIGAQESDIAIYNGRIKFMLNDVEVPRQIRHEGL
ncbi:MAG: EAL domain-containing protein [Lachnospiraceae bacterium]|nr:EAL domain-containing protein [Lachnospiraceae bacterium]